MTIKKTMAKNLRTGHRFTTARRGYNTATLTVRTILGDPERNELDVGYEDHLGRKDYITLREFQEVQILNWED